MTAQAALLPARPVPASDTRVVSDALCGVVVHPAAGSLRVRGLNAVGAFVVARCDRSGRDLRPEQLLVLPADAPELASITNRLRRVR